MRTINHEGKELEVFSNSTLLDGIILVSQKSVLKIVLTGNI